MIPMIDATHSHVINVPQSAKRVAGYVSGSPDILWTPSDWTLFRNSQTVRIYQGNGPLDVHNLDVVDVESGAVIPTVAASIVHARVASGIKWTTIYASESNLQITANAVKEFGSDLFTGHVFAWLADWNLSEQEATARLGTFTAGMTTVAVQWASPASNPDTIVPGGTMALKDAQVDLSVSEDTWPAVISQPPPAPRVLSVSIQVTSDDDGHTWQARIA